MAVTASNLKLLGGALCLNFVDTRNWDPAEQPYDFFSNYLALLEWGLQLGVFTLPQADHLHQIAAQHDREAQAVLDKAVRLRLSIYRVFSGAVLGKKAPDEDLALLNDVLSEALSHLQVSSDRGRFAWEWAKQDLSLESVLWKVVQSAGDLLTSERLERVKRCDGCGWLFLDTTRSGRRRWCDMRLCGNRAKARRHYARKKAEI